MTHDELFTNPFDDEDEDEGDETLYRLTGKGLHQLGALDDQGLEHFARIEAERDGVIDLLDEYDQIIGFLFAQLTAVATSESLTEVREIAYDALSQIEQVPHE